MLENDSMTSNRIKILFGIFLLVGLSFFFYSTNSYAETNIKPNTPKIISFTSRKIKDNKEDIKKCN